MAPQNLRFSLTTYVGIDPARKSHQSIRLLFAPDYTCMTAAREKENTDTTLLGVQTVLLKTLSAQYFIKLNKTHVLV